MIGFLGIGIAGPATRRQPRHCLRLRRVLPHPWLQRSPHHTLCSHCCGMQLFATLSTNFRYWFVVSRSGLVRAPIIDRNAMHDLIAAGSCRGRCLEPWYVDRKDKLKLTHF